MRSGNATVRWGLRLALVVGVVGAAAVLWSSAAEADPLEDGLSLGSIGEGAASIVDVVTTPPSDPAPAPRPLSEILDGLGPIVQQPIDDVLSGLPELPVPGLPGLPPEVGPLPTDGGTPGGQVPTPATGSPNPGGGPSSATPLDPADTSVQTPTGVGPEDVGAHTSGASTTPDADEAPPSSEGAPPLRGAPLGSVPVPSGVPTGSEMAVGVMTLASFALALLVMRLFAEQKPGKRHPVFAIDTPPG